MDKPAPDHLRNGVKEEPPKHGHPSTEHQHLWLITGPAGCGKSTVGLYVAKALGIDYLEGDEFHTPGNVEKMRSGHPLTDTDRWDWLIRLRTAALKSLLSPKHASGVVVSCSALKQKYRDVMRVVNYYNPNILVHFVYLHASEAVLLERVQGRQGHYMGANMVHSQLESLEEPGQDETDVLAVDVSGTKADVEAEALRKVKEAVRVELTKDSS